MTRAFTIRLFVTYVIVCAVMVLFESTKQLLWPSITVWQSHVLTIFFSSTAATTAAYFAFRGTDKSAVIGDTASPREIRKMTLLIAGGLILLLLPSFAALTLVSRYNSQDNSPSEIRLSTTTSTVDSGLLEELIPLFEKTHPYKVRTSATGTSAALEKAQSGGADVVLCHARKAEDKFVQEGYGVNRQDVMYNDFILVGPEQPDANVPVSNDIVQTLKNIQATGQPFLSRGDKSGTHIREKELWQIAEIEPKGDWYTETGKEMLTNLRMASERKAYTLADRGTYLANSKELHLRIVCEGDSRLFNRYGVIAVNPAKIAGVNFKGAMAFLRFLVSDEGQAAIGKYGVDRFQRPLFVPTARK